MNTASTLDLPAFYAGDVIQLRDRIPHRPALQAGLEGVVLVGDESGGEIWGLVSVQLGGRAWYLHRRHLKLLERAPRCEDDADA